jgi:hypothetical protein
LAVFVLLAVALGVVATRFDWFRGSHGGPRPLAVPAGDQEIAWLHNPTAFETWENFVWAVKRAEMAGESPSGLEVDDAGAYPDRTTDVPEVVIRRKGFSGSLRIRWYKVTDEATQEAWVNALAVRDPAPIAVLGGWTSDRAKELADAMRDAKWSGPKPLLFMTQATADEVYSENDRGGGPSLVGVYDRSFRFCFTNKQMAEAVTDYVLSDPTLRPGPVVWPGLRVIPAAAAGPWAALNAVAIDTRRDLQPIPAFVLDWQDDPYSTDLSLQFRTQLGSRSTPAAGLPSLSIFRSQIPFSTGRMNRATRAEAEAADYILANLPPPGVRTVLVVPTVTAPARRTLRALVQGNPAVGRQLVAVNGDGIGVNTFFRDREFAWPVRSLTIPLVFFTHADPFAWDARGSGRNPPPGYEIPPPEPGSVRSSIEDIQLFTRLTRIVASGVFPNGAAEIARSPDALADALRKLSPGFFDAAGNRLSGTGEHVVVLRPTFRGDGLLSRPQTDAVLEVYARESETRKWNLIHTQMLGRPHGGNPE